MSVTIKKGAFKYKDPITGTYKSIDAVGGNGGGSGGAVTSVNGRTGNVTGLQEASNLVTSLSASSTNTQYPSAKCVYDLVGNVETLLASI